MHAPVVTFDAGQTLIDLDLDFLARRLGERGVVVGREALEAAAPAAWRRYDALVDPAGGHPWKQLMATLLGGAGVPGVEAQVEWLWEQQPTQNLWRARVPGMVELAAELAGRGVRVAVLSNSEGKLAELLEEIGVAEVFGAIIDSGKIGIEKPDPRIFAHTIEALGGGDAGIHVGDSWPADIAGALGAGWRGIWFGRRAHAVDDPRVGIARDAAEVREILDRWLEVRENR